MDLQRYMRDIFGGFCLYENCFSRFYRYTNEFLVTNFLYKIIMIVILKIIIWIWSTWIMDLWGFFFFCRKWNIFDLTERRKKKKKPKPNLEMTINRKVKKNVINNRKKNY